MQNHFLLILKEFLGRFYDTKTQSKILRSDKNFEKKGRIKLPAYFVRFGVVSSLELFVKNREAMEKEEKVIKLLL